MPFYDGAMLVFTKIRRMFERIFLYFKFICCAVDFGHLKMYLPNIKFNNKKNKKTFKIQ